MRCISRPTACSRTLTQLRMSLAIGFYPWRQESPARPACFPYFQLCARAFFSRRVGTGSGFIGGGR
jgi:hypothetical protein